MKKMITAFAAVSLVMGVSACGEKAADDTQAVADAGTITGNWRANVESAEFENDNLEYALADGKIECRSCLPPYSVAANGEWQKVDRPGTDGMMVKVVDDHTVMMASRLGEKDLGNVTWTVSEDGKMLTGAFQDLSGDVPVSSSGTYNRVSEGAAGSHALSGKWASAEISDVDEAGLVFSYTLDGDKLTLKDNDGGWTATVGGDPVAVEGSNSNVMVAVAGTGDNAYRVTVTREGEVLRLVDLSVEGDTMSVVSSDPRDNSTVRWTATRQ